MGLAAGFLLLGAAVVALAISAGKGATAAASAQQAVNTQLGAPAVTAGSGKSQGAVSFSQLQQIGAAYGWTGAELDSWWNVISAESGGDPTSRNPSSGAFGIGQFLGQTLHDYAPFGATSTDPVQQLQAMARYIHDRYGTPSVAWAHEQSAHWY